MPRVLLIALAIFCTAANADAVPLASDLETDGRQAIAGAKPVVVLFSASYCGYCTAVKTEFFQHLEQDARYRSKVILREVVIDGADSLRDFGGNTVSHGEFADRHGVHLVPTVRFFDGAGVELAEPMVGVSTMDFYGWYLDLRIRRSIDRLDPGRKGAAGGEAS